MNAQAAVIAHLTAENAQLRAEVERLTALERLTPDYQTLEADRARRAAQPALRISPRMEAA